MPDLLPLLRSLDDAEHLEFPAGYDHAETRARFDALAQRLDTTFDCESDVGRDIQDASFHGRIAIPATATASGRPLIVVISNFGNLAALLVGATRVDFATAELMHPDDARQLETVLTELGYTLVPADLLRRRYDGAWDPKSLHADQEPDLVDPLLRLRLGSPHSTEWAGYDSDLPLRLSPAPQGTLDHRADNSDRRARRPRPRPRRGPD